MKNLNTYIQEGLFDNVGVGYDAQITNWLDKNLPEAHKHKYTITEDGLINLEIFGGTIFAHNDRRNIEVPKNIQLNELMIYSEYRFGEDVYFNRLNVEDWEAFLPKKINSGNYISYCFADSNISNKDLKYLTLLVRNKQLGDLGLQRCKNLTSLKGCPDLTFREFGTLNLNDTEITSLDGLYMEDISNNDSLYLYCNNCIKLKHIGKCKADIKNLLIQGTPLAKKIKNHMSKKYPYNYRFKLGEEWDFIHYMEQCPEFMEFAYKFNGLEKVYFDEQNDDNYLYFDYITSNDSKTWGVQFEY